MAFPSQTLATMVRRGLAYSRTSFPGFPLGMKSFLARTARSVALPVWGLHKAIEEVVKDIIPRPQSSTDALSEWAYSLGLPDGEGGYGRLKPTAASGGVATFVGTKGTTYPDNSTATAEDGITQVKLSGAVAIPGSGTGFGSIPGRLVAVTKGTSGNLPAGTKFTWDNAPTGSEPGFTLTSELSRGTDLEDNPSVFARIIQAMQTPPRGGVAEDFRRWLQEVSGIVGVWVYPKRGGTGTVDVVFTTGGSGQGRLPSAALLDLARDKLNERVPLWPEWARIVEPYAPDANGHAVVVKVTPATSDFRFDWDDTAATYLVASYAAGPPATLELDQVAPATLTAAIDAYKNGTGAKPRLQVISTGAVVNPSIEVVDYVTAGTTTLTLGTVPDGWTAPTVGDRVYAYGPVVATIAAGVKASVDVLGPSRASGYGDPITPWSDELTISSIIGIAEAAIDSYGNKLIGKVPPGDVTIDGVSNDVQGTDGTNGPELLFLRSVAVVAA